MQQVTKLHEKAMELADRADQARRVGDRDTFHALTREALRHEADAALMVADQTALEPTRSVLFRSAATLAIEVGSLRVAEQLIGRALAGEPPKEIAEELRDLLEDVYFRRHLEIRGVTLCSGDVQMSIEGDVVGAGIARSDAFVQRVRDLETLLYRTTERRLGRPFREKGRRLKKLAESVELYLSVPRAASFAVTLRVGQGTQFELPGIRFTAEALTDVLDGLGMINSGDLETLQRAIPDESYRVNFLALASRIAPDGKDVRTVGFTAQRDGKTRTIALVIPRRVLRKRMLKNPTREQSVAAREIQITGILLEADATKQDEGVIEVVGADKVTHRIAVPRGMMSDIVKPMFEEEVVVTGIEREGRIELLTIDLAETEGS